MGDKRQHMKQLAVVVCLLGLVWLPFVASGPVHSSSFPTAPTRDSGMRKLDPPIPTIQKPKPKSLPVTPPMRISNSSSVSNTKRTVPPVLVAVVTAPLHKDARSAILASWASRTDPSSHDFDANIARVVAVRFFVGEVPSLNSTQNHDITAEPLMVRVSGFEEKYENLSFKTAAILAWAFDNGYDHVLKVDDDVFLQLDQFVTWFHTLTLPARSYGGEFVRDAGVNSNPNSKWYMADQYPHPSFPTYAFGSCYFVGKDIVTMVASHRETLRRFRVEDAGLAIWIEEAQANSTKTSKDKLKITYVDMDNMYFQAECWNPIAVYTTPVNSQEMGVMWEGVKRFASPCGDPYHPIVLEECVARRCRCYPLPDGGACDEALANQQYTDLIPRL